MKDKILTREDIEEIEVEALVCLKAHSKHIDPLHCTMEISHEDILALIRTLNKYRDLAAGSDYNLQEMAGLYIAHGHSLSSSLSKKEWETQRKKMEDRAQTWQFKEEEE